MQNSWRGGYEWREANLPLNTGSEEACKLYDASLSQLVGFYSDKTLGGLGKTMGKLIAADPNFVMGHVLCTGLSILGTGKTVFGDANLRNQTTQLLKLMESQSDLSNREKSHVKAIELWSRGELRQATLEWESLIHEHPTDMLALKFSTDGNFFMGMGTLMRDNIAGVLPYWKPSTPFYHYIHGMYSFGLVESRCYEKAEKVALKGLEINPLDGFATHGLDHVYEMQGKADEGINWLNNTVKDWEFSDVLVGHNYWHLALFHIEKMEYETALEILEKELMKRATDEPIMLDILDISSLLYRLSLEGFEISQHWHKLYELCLPNLEDHALLFNDMHFMMVLLGHDDKAATDKFMASLIKNIQEEKGHNSRLNKDIGLKLMKSFIAAKEQRYADAVDILNPIRFELFRMGGSGAQRDVLDMLLITCAIKSNEPSHKRFGKSLLLQRQGLKTNCSLQERWKIQHPSIFTSLGLV